MAKGIKKIASALLVLAMAGCQVNPPAPTEEDARAAWHHIAEQTNTAKMTELLSLKKTDGQMQEVHGTKVYTFFYQAKVRFLAPVGSWKPGDIQTVNSNYGFQRTENGWQGPDGTTYTK